MAISHMIVQFVEVPGKEATNVNLRSTILVLNR